MGEHTAGSFADELPPATGAELAQRIGERRPVVFLDYDGTLVPIVDHPDRAVLSEGTKRALQRLSDVHPVAVVSGRDREDVQGKVGLDSVYYAGSHGFDISGPGGFREQRGAEYRSMLRLAADELDEEVAAVAGAWVERKRYAVAVHFRQAPPGSEDRLRTIVERVARSHPTLRSSGGKKIFELRPNLEWDKGRAVLWLLEALDLPEHEFLPIYVGDDETDEDAFRALRDRGLGIVVDDSHRTTLATLALADPEEVRTFLDRLTEWTAR